MTEQNSKLSTEEIKVYLFRKMLKEALGELPPYDGGERLSIETNLLEKVIFSEPYEVDGEKRKKIIFPGEVLAYIDLSNVSFKNVDLDLKFNEHLDLSHTNATIVYCGTRIINCDLSNKGEFFFHVNISSIERIKNSSLVGVNLSGQQIREGKFFNRFQNVNLAQTGLKILFSTADETIKSGGINELRRHNDHRNELKKLISKGYLDNCFINEARVVPKEEREKRREEESKKARLCSYRKAMELLAEQKLTLDNYVKDVKQRQKKK